MQRVRKYYYVERFEIHVLSALLVNSVQKLSELLSESSRLSPVLLYLHDVEFVSDDGDSEGEETIAFLVNKLRDLPADVHVVASTQQQLKKFDPSILSKFYFVHA